VDDEGKLRVAEPSGGRARGWQVHQWQEGRALWFRLNDGQIPGGRSIDAAVKWWDKGASGIRRLVGQPFSRRRFRAVPGAIVRHSPTSRRTSS
jgi:2,3,4,5-tetrahydropyridine-2-carboxylate N-succinyltransferase